MCHSVCGTKICQSGLGTSGAASVLDHQHPGDLSQGDLPDAAEAFKNVLLVCHTNPTAVDLTLSGRGEVHVFSVVSSCPIHSYPQSS